MPTYAKRTTVAPEKSRMEIEFTIKRYKADQFGTAFDNDGHRAMVQFRMRLWIIRFELPLPDPKKLSRSAYEQRERQCWRALALAIKAKLEAVESGITTFEEEFLSHIVLPSGQTAGKWLVPQLEQARESGEMPRTLLEYRGNKTDA